MSDLKILLVRHPVSQWNKDGIHQGQSWKDPGLAKEGVRQAIRLADYLEKKPVLAIWSSPLPRTMQTAKEIHKRHVKNRAPLISNQGLMEITHGVVDGMHYSEIRRQFPREWENMKNRIWTDEPLFPEGESPVQAARRKLTAQFAIARLAHIFKINSKLPDDGIIVVVAHGAVNCFFLCEITNTPLGEGWDKFPQDNACINTIIWNDTKGKFTIESVNDTTHLGDLRYTPQFEI